MYTAIITVQTYMKDAGTHVYGTLHMPTQSEKKQSVKQSSLCPHMQNDLLLGTFSTWCSSLDFLYFSLQQMLQKHPGGAYMEKLWYVG